MKKEYTFNDLRQLYKSSVRKLTALQQFPEEQLLLKPDPSSWSVHEIIEHILLFNKIYHKMIQSTLQKDNHPLSASKSFSARFFIRPFISFVEPPYKIKIKTISPMRPAGENHNQTYQLLDELISFNTELIQLIEELTIQNLDLNRIKGRNKVFKFKMTLTEFFLMLAAHQDRHIWQAEQTLKKIS